mmetsp:Transcript_40/g.112  ORF Transcript_40/g.112 Transcript_40/m.112 type:complete len:368 (+) Transcript_40:427-1530(+)
MYVSLGRAPRRRPAERSASFTLSNSSSGRGRLSSTSMIAVPYFDTSLASAARSAASVASARTSSASSEPDATALYGLAVSIAATSVKVSPLPSFSIRRECTPSSRVTRRICDSSESTTAAHSRAHCARRSSSICRYSPWSSSTSCTRPRPSVRTRMLPGCASQCTQPETNIISPHTCPSSRATPRGSRPSARTDAASDAGVPASKSIVSTRAELSCACTRGTRTRSPKRRARHALHFSALRASLRKSSSSGRLSRTSSTSHSKPNDGSSSRTTRTRAARSPTSVRSMSCNGGCCTFTASMRPSASERARCTCASEADAMGSRSNSAKSASTGAPSSSCSISRTRSYGVRGAQSKSGRRARRYGSGTR